MKRIATHTLFFVWYSVRDYPWLTLLLALFGAVSSGQWIIKVTRIFFQIFLLPGKNVCVSSGGCFVQGLIFSGLIAAQNLWCKEGSVGWSVAKSLLCTSQTFEFYMLYVVITGATDGIGREFAIQLGKAGFNIFLASRSKEKLNAVAAELGHILFFSISMYLEIDHHGRFVYRCYRCTNQVACD